MKKPAWDIPPNSVPKDETTKERHARMEMLAKLTDTELLARNYNPQDPELINWRLWVEVDKRETEFRCAVGEASYRDYQEFECMQQNDRIKARDAGVISNKDLAALEAYVKINGINRYEYWRCDHDLREPAIQEVEPEVEQSPQRTALPDMLPEEDGFDSLESKAEVLEAKAHKAGVCGPIVGLAGSRSMSRLYADDKSAMRRQQQLAAGKEADTAETTEFAALKEVEFAKPKEANGEDQTNGDGNVEFHQRGCTIS